MQFMLYIVKRFVSFFKWKWTEKMVLIGNVLVIVLGKHVSALFVVLWKKWPNNCFYVKSSICIENKLLSFFCCFSAPIIPLISHRKSLSWKMKRLIQCSYIESAINGFRYVDKVNWSFAMNHMLWFTNQCLRLAQDTHTNEANWVSSGFLLLTKV